MSDHNECPTCTQDWVANTDYECGCCGRPASEHIRVTSLCRILRETQQREHTLERERNKHHEDADAFLDKWSKAQERAIDAERERDAERALADLLASSLLLTLSAWITSPDAERAAAALRAWKEARKEARNEI